MKFLHYNRKFVNVYFWRTHQQREIDYIEESDGRFTANEIKWGRSVKIRTPEIFAKAYHCEEITLINRDSFMPFIGVE